MFAHGSTVESANDAVRAVTSRMARRGGYDLVETAFLEGGKPDLMTAAETLIQRGARRIVVLPYFLTLGTHLKRDLPRLVAEIRQVHPEIEMQVTPPLDGHPALEQILVARAEEVLRLLPHYREAV